MKYYKKMEGELCYLSPISIDDASLYTEWLNNLDITQYLTLNVLNIGIEGEKAALSRLAGEHAYAIVEKENNSLIGNCGIHNWDKVHQNAEVGIFIGNEDFLGKGYGTEALRLLLEYGFDYLNIHSVLLRVFSHNERAIASYRKIGFREIGEWRASLNQKGEKHGIIFMDLLADEFKRLKS